MADEKVTIDVDVNTEEAEGKFERLQGQIRKLRVAFQ